MNRREVDPLDRAAARKAAIRLIERQDRTTADMRARLVARGYAMDTVEAVIDRLVTNGLLDDRRFAERFAELATNERGMGSRRIKLELVRRGVDRETATETGLDVSADDRERAFALATKRVPRLKQLPREVAYRRLFGFLARKGYSPDICQDAIKRAMKATILSEPEL